jgi:hypothetical protein
MLPHNGPRKEVMGPGTTIDVVSKHLRRKEVSRGRWRKPIGPQAVGYGLATLAGCIMTIAAMRVAPSPATAPMVTLGESTLETSTPALTIRQRQQAVDVARASKPVRQLIGDHFSGATGIATWTTVDGQVLGAVVRVALLRLTTIQGEWLALDYGCMGHSSTRYASVPYYAKRSNVRYLSIFVDLLQSRVAAIDADPASRLRGTIPEIPARSMNCRANSTH